MCECAEDIPQTSVEFVLQHAGDGFDEQSYVHRSRDCGPLHSQPNEAEIHTEFVELREEGESEREWREGGEGEKRREEEGEKGGEGERERKRGRESVYMLCDAESGDVSALIQRVLHTRDWRMRERIHRCKQVTLSLTHTHTHTNTSPIQNRFTKHTGTPLSPSSLSSTNSV